MNKPLTYISLFSSAGVGCYGFKQNGFECIATNEILTKRLKIQAFNNKCKYETGYLDGDISTKEIKDKLFHYNLDNAEVFSQQISQIEDRKEVMYRVSKYFLER